MDNTPRYPRPKSQTHKKSLDQESKAFQTNDNVTGVLDKMRARLKNKKILADYPAYVRILQA